MYSCPTLEKSAAQPKTTSLCSSITVITLWGSLSQSPVSWLPALGAVGTPPRVLIVRQNRLVSFLILEMFKT